MKTDFICIYYYIYALLVNTFIGILVPVTAN